MSYSVVFSNPGGELDRRPAQTPQEATEVAIAMIKDAGELHDGDSITVESVE